MKEKTKIKLTKIMRIIPDTMFIKIVYRIKMKKQLNLKNPKTYNEKLQWLKLYDKNPKYTEMVDKFEVKKYVSSIIGEEYIIPTLGIYERFDDIDFEKLPNKFVIKCTHDSGGIVICNNKESFNIEEARKKINQALKYNYFWYSREFPYKYIKPRIIVEKYMEDSKSKALDDYKFFCFDGSCKFMFIATDRMNKKEDTKFDFFDREFNFIDVLNGHPNAKERPKKPQNFEIMIELAEKLSKDIPQVRVDFYEIDGKIYFGELTFFHWGGFTPFKPDKYDYIFGEYIKLPRNTKE